MNKQLVQTKQVVTLKNGSITTPKGYYAGGLHCGIKRKRLDLGWLFSEVPATVAAVYTTNQIQAAPLLVTKESIKISGKIQGVIVNSGIANACTGDEGYKNALFMRKLFADRIGVDEHLVAVSSTGIIGEQLPMQKLEDGINQIHHLDNDVDCFEKAILTTDTTQKKTCVQLKIDGKTITIAGCAKGSGMIHPNMATMLGFITTDANISQEALNIALKQSVNQTFNMITVDGDTSTNDMVVFLANGLAGNPKLTQHHAEWDTFLSGVYLVCESLAKQIAKDGEGATKLIEVKVKGCNTSADAGRIAKSIIGSNLVKTAMFGEDPNWGRIVAAIGYSGVQLNSNSIDVYIGEQRVVKNGLPETYSEENVTTYLKENEEIQIIVDLHDGKSNATAWGCDLTYDYVKINAMYRT
jgi:glutamate N-acetyltransferase / amino-acid N-acetyltransferase